MSQQADMENGNDSMQIVTQQVSAQATGSGSKDTQVITFNHNNQFQQQQQQTFAAKKRNRGKSTGTDDTTPATTSDIRQLLKELRDDLEQRADQREKKLDQIWQQQQQKLSAVESQVKTLTTCVRDQKWIRSKAANIKISPGPSPTVAAFDFQGNLTDPQKQQKILDACNWIVGQFSYTPIKQQCLIVKPKNPNARSFMIVRFTSEAIADYVRSHWMKFKNVGVFIGEDLTPAEQATRNQILTIMKAYWNRSQIPNSRFLRDQLKCMVNGSLRILSLEEVQQFVAEKRIDAYVDSKNVSSGQS